MWSLLFAISFFSQFRPNLPEQSSTQWQAFPKPRIVIKKSDYKLYLYCGDVLEKVYPIAVGKNKGDKEAEGDMRTPEGYFYISQIQNSEKWTHDFKDGKGEIAGAYGPWFLRLHTSKERTKSGKAWRGIGIHGTHDESSIGTAATEGCIRLRNSDLLDLKSRIRIGTEVRIVE